MKKTVNRKILFVLAFMIAVLFVPNVSYATTYADEADTITYSTDMEEAVDFVLSDFENACDDLTDEDLDYVKFTLPSSSYGTLYYDFDTEKNSDEVTASKKYYADITPRLSKVSFLPDDDYSGTVTIKYTGYNTEGDYYTGKIKISVDDDDDDTAEDLTFSIDADEELDFDEDDFNEVCDDLNDEDLDYVKFVLPSSSAGTLYYQYTSESKYSSKVTNSAKYYYDKSPSISDVTFVPDKDYDGTLTIKYTGYDADGVSFEGRIKLSINESDSDKAKEISYNVNTGKTLDFDDDDFNDVCNDLNDEDLDYVNFTLPSSSKGVLYYDYDDDDGEYDSKVSESKDYYCGKTPKLSKVTFVPSKNYSGIFKISYQGYDVKGKSYEGTVEITVDGGSLQTAGVITYTAKTGSVVYFKDEDFNNACKKLKNKNLNYVKFTLPSAASGKLYYGYTSSKNYSSEVSASTSYYYGSGAPFLLNVAFVPAGSYTGITTIDYTGYDADGSAFKGQVQITLSSTGTATTPSTGTNTTPSSGTLKKSQYFNDVDEAYSWAVDYIDKLYQDGIITGSTGDDGKKHFYPAAKIKRGEFMLLLYKALNLTAGSSAGNFSDVAKGEYYYDAIASAKALGIAQGSDNKFYPNASITREDTMVLALRAMNKSGYGIAAGDVSTLSAYGDNNVIDAYAKDAIAALIKAGIITGSDDNKIHPMEQITRAEAAAIIYRIKY